MDLQGSLLKNSWIDCCTLEMEWTHRQAKPRATWRLMPLSRKHFSTGPIGFLRCVIHVQFFEPNTEESTGIINAIKQRIHLNGCLQGWWQCALASLSLSAKILAAAFPLRVLHTEIINVIVDVLSSGVRLRSPWLWRFDPQWSGERHRKWLHPCRCCARSSHHWFWP